MIVAAMIGYYVAAVGLIALVAYLTGRQANREIEAAGDAAMARMEAEFGRTPMLEPYVREPLPEFDDPEPELRVTIRRHPEPDSGELPKIAAQVIREASRLERSFGGDGLEYDAAGSVEEPDRLVLRLVPVRDDWEAADRLAAVSVELNRVARQTEEAVERQHQAVLTRIGRELGPHLPPGLIERVEVTDGATDFVPSGVEPIAVAS